MLYLCQHHNVGHALVSFMVLLHVQPKLPTYLHFFVNTGTSMADFTEIPLELQLKETHCQNHDHLAEVQPVPVTNVSSKIPCHHGKSNIRPLGYHHWPV